MLYHKGPLEKVTLMAFVPQPFFQVWQKRSEARELFPCPACENGERIGD